MISVAIVGILAAVAVPMFASVMRKAKQTEVKLELDQLIKRVKLFHAENSRLPTSATTVRPLVAACESPTGKTSVERESAWFSDPGWRELGFHIDEPGYYQYAWLNLGTPTFPLGYAYAWGDTDCDGMPQYYLVLVQGFQGGMLETELTFLDD